MFRRLGVVCLVMSLGLLAACSSRGTAPVYNRHVTQKPVKVTQVPDFYTVRRGDTLYSIAWRHHMDHQRLAVWNRVRAPHYRIYPGQRLRLKPPPVTKRKTTVTISKPPQPSSTVPRQPIPTRTDKPKSVPSHAPAKPVQKPKAPPKSVTPRLKLDWRWPTKGSVIQTFSANDPARRGVWIRGALGQPVVAAESGKVVYSGSGLVGYGNLIIIKHDDKYLSAYGYNKKLLVKEGDKVLRNERIAEMGSPRNGADAVLHFEIRKLGKPINPLPLLPR